MKKGMKKWLSDIRQSPVKKAMPVLSFPSVQLMGISVRELISDSQNQARGMKLIADRLDTYASLSMMDLSVEAEAFGSKIRICDDEVPTVTGCILQTEDDARALRVPKVGEGRTGLYIKAAEQAAGLIADRPVFAGVIGPFSLAGRLMDVSEIMVNCYAEPDMVHITMRKATDFIISYIEGYRATGAGGVVVAEPLAGLLSPGLMEEFATPYMKEIVDSVQSDDFLVVYHNCGNNTLDLIDSILKAGASIYHFGNAISMERMLGLIPEDIVVMGNIDPAGEFRNGTPESVRKATLDLLKACSRHPNFVISSGCDIPPLAKWENIDAFMQAVKDFYA